MGNKECFEKFAEQIAEMVESMHEIMQSLIESIVAFTHVMSEVLYELVGVSNEAYKNLIVSINQIPKVSGMFELEYERKIQRYRKKYKQPLKHFLGKHPIIRDIFLAVLVEIILSIAGYLINNALDYMDNSEAISYSIDYNVKDSTLDFHIKAKELETGDQLYLPDGNVLIFQAQ